MIMKICVLLFGTIRLTSQIQVSTEEYVAAVVEIGDRPSDTKWPDYTKLIAEAAVLNADIIIFPEEYGESSGKPVQVPFKTSRGQKTPMLPAMRPDLYDERLVLMSDAARNNSIYVVVNYPELLDCTQEAEESCPEQKQYVFNTDVVFDRSGSVVLRYRKNYLFGEPDKTPSFKKGPGIFHTDFGVTFGLCICYDVLNQVPMEALGMNIKNLLVNANWVTLMPFLTAVQAHESFAYGMNVNLIVSGFNNVSNSASGSGMYSGKAGSLISFITGESKTKLLVSRIPKIPGNTKKTTGPLRQTPKALDGLIVVQDLSVLSHITRVLEPGYQDFTLKYKDVTCRFKILMRERDGEQKYKYRAGAFCGVSSVPIGGVQIATRDCAVFSCTGDSTDTCGNRFPSYVENSTAVFDTLHIEGTIPTPVMNPKTQASTSTFYPSTLDVSFLPLEPEDFEYFVEEKGEKTVHSLSLKNVKAQLYTFAIWGRLYEKDGDKLTDFFEEVERAVKGENDNDEVKREDGVLIGDQKEDVQEDNDAGMVINLNGFEGFKESSLSDPFRN